jgi:hypothetical protein
MSQSPDLSTVSWRKSRRSQEQGACVEVASVAGVVAVRDSKDVGGAVLCVGREAFRALVRDLRAGRHDVTG